MLHPIATDVPRVRSPAPGVTVRCLAIRSRGCERSTLSDRTIGSLPPRDGAPPLARIPHLETTMITNTREATLKTAVERELRLDPRVNETEIGVALVNGVVTLGG